MPGKITHPRSKISGNEGGFKEFRIEELFEVQKISSKLKKSDLNSQGDIPVFSSESSNNGILGYCDKPPHFEVSPNNTFFAIFGDHSRTINFSTNSFCVADNVKVLKPKIKSLYAAFYISSVWKKAFPNLGYARHWSIAKNVPFSLPTTKKGDIDFSYMEQYIDELQHQQHNKIENFLKSVGLDNCELTKKEKTSLCKFNNQQIEFKQFDIVKKFDVTNSQNNLKSDVVFESGDIPYVTASEGNNSVVSRISCADNLKESGNSIMIGGKTLVITYQPEDFVSNDSHNLILYLKDSAKRTENIQLFCVCSLNHFLKPIYSWGDSISKTKIQKDVFSLPVTPQGNIDYDFMETFISAQKKLIAQKVVRWLKQQQINDNVLEIERNLPKEVLPMAADKGYKN